MKKYLLPALLLGWFTFHLAFLTADPDTEVDIHTRGAWTDEGLWSSQSRNLVDTGRFDLYENSTFIRAPLFGLLQMIVFYLFGTRLIVLRLTIVLFTLTGLILFAVKRPLYRPFLIFLLLSTYLEFHVFQFTHYGMAELLCIQSVMMSLYFLVRWKEQSLTGKSNIFLLFYASLFIFIGYSFKIQYLYLAGLLPLMFFLISLKDILFNRIYLNIYFKAMLYTLLFTAGLLLIYGIWFFSNKDFYQYVMANETAGRFPANLHDAYQALRYTLRHYLFAPSLKALMYTGLAALIYLFSTMRKKEHFLDLPFFFAFSWIVLELHKLPMIYLPNRYLLPLFFAVGMMASIGMASLFESRHWIRSLAWCFSIALGLLNLSADVQAYNRRTHDLEKLNHYLGQYDLKGGNALGSWATVAAWDSKVRTVPVWKDYINDHDPLGTYRPVVVLSEANEAESDKAYSSQGIDLLEESDSSRVFHLWRYEVNCFWLKRRP